MTTIDGHTFYNHRLLGGWTIDAGCRGFDFTRFCLNRGPVYSLDIEKFEVPPMVGQMSHKVIFKQAALTYYSGHVDAYFFGNGTGNFIRPVNEAPGNTEDRPCEMRTVPAITLDDIYKEIGTDIDLLKLDIEGSEYEVMMKMEPIPKQVSVETHEHCHPHLHNEYWPKILERMCKHYYLHLFNVEPRYHFMDCLFIRKDLI